MFADNTKFLRKIRNHKDCEEMLNDLNQIYQRSRISKMELNARSY